MGNPREWSRITVMPEGFVQVAVGTLSSGQGHETSFTQCVAEWFGVDFEKVRLVQGDTDLTPIGGGSHSGRSMRMAGFVMGRACEAVLSRARPIAAEMLDAPAESLAFGGGRFTAPASGRSVDLFDIAKAAYALNSIDDSLRGPLAGEHSELFRAPGYPYGTAVCELEIDPATGRIELRRWSAVDDVGRAVNPMILDGQTHGAAVQGIGQLLWEHCATDPETGQVIAGSFMDYAMPRADWLISFDTELMEVPSTSNPLGVRAGGEGGTTPALAAGVNAIVDALADYNVEHVDMPATSEKIWRLIREKRAC